MQYRTLSVAAALVASASAATTITSLETVTEHSTTDVTITSCSKEACATTVEKSSLTVVTTTVEGIETIYTTYCPLSSEIAAESVVAPSSATVITTTVEGIETIYTTYCPLTEGEKAAESEAPVAPAAPSSVETVITTTVAGVETIYTTYCPATEEATPATEAPAPAPTVAASEEITYVDLTTTPVVTASTGVEETLTEQYTLTSYYSSANASVAGVATYEGKANAQNFAVGVAGVAGLAAVLL
ncbi:uncharacterized protein RJT20DRAFT_48512 [Scheffersomyces xylosifermentans]|uniref:uncharacterized protein n=1 Tax=Scheffersomyces xylosifermentans TaxID=1304137 RepID=UPI00315C6F3A